MVAMAVALVVASAVQSVAGVATSAVASQIVVVAVVFVLASSPSSQ